MLFRVVTAIVSKEQYNFLKAIQFLEVPIPLSGAITAVPWLTNHLLGISCAWQAFVLGVLLLLLQVNHTATLRGLYYYHQHFRELEKQKCRV